MIILEKKKIAGLAAAGIAGAGALYFGTGAFFYGILLSKHHVNKKITERVLSAAEIADCEKNGCDDAGAWWCMMKPEEYRLVSSHGETLHAEVIKQKDGSHKWAILGHGWTNHPAGMCSFAKHFHEMGFNVLVPYLGAHEKSEKKYVSMGWADRFDIVDWANYITWLDSGAQICLHGVSMGAATMMMTAGQEDLPASVKCVIEDCGFTTLRDMGFSIVKEFLHIPPYMPISAANTVTKILNGYSFEEVSAIDQIRKCRIPVFFIHGTEDNFVPYKMCGELYDAARCEKQMLSVPDSGHTESSTMHPELYWPAVAEFTGKYII